MIRGRLRSQVLGVSAMLLVGSLLSLRPADPSAADPGLDHARLAHLGALAAEADGRLSELIASLESAVEHVRSGAVQTRSGDTPPEAELVAAAEIVQQAAATADSAVVALRRLAGVASAVAPGSPAPVAPANGPDLLILAAQLHASAEAATTFVERRRATEAVTRSLAAAAEALDRDDPAAALARLAEGDQPLALLRTWQQPPETFGFWLSTVGELHGAARGIAEATLAGDPEAVAVAAARYAAAAEVARGADNALALALSEGASGTTLVVQRRLADLLAELLQARGAVALLGGPAVGD